VNASQRVAFRKTFGGLTLAVLALSASGCATKLPEPESDGAKLYAARCDSCHRLFPPSSLKSEMWKMKVESMQGEMARHGLPPLTDQERATVLDYLQRHSA
jgi:mono/diheme cytochrome c family protein